MKIKIFKKIKDKINYFYHTFIIVTAIYISENRVTSVANNKKHLEATLQGITSYVSGARSMRHRFWKTSLISLFLITLIIFILYLCNKFSFTINNCFRVIAVFAFTISSFSYVPLQIERTLEDNSIISEAMFYQKFISQLSGTILLILALWL